MNFQILDWFRQKNVISNRDLYLVYSIRSVTLMIYPAQPIQWIFRYQKNIISSRDLYLISYSSLVYSIRSVTLMILLCRSVRVPCWCNLRLARSHSHFSLAFPLLALSSSKCAEVGIAHNFWDNSRNVIIWYQPMAPQAILLRHWTRI